MEEYGNGDPIKLWQDPINRAICGRCKGQCCYLRGVRVLLDRERAERRLHQYKYTNETRRCFGQTISLLKKRKDGSCVYYDRETRTCTIYDNRPASCQVFFCGRGTKNDRVWKGLLEEERK